LNKFQKYNGYSAMIFGCNDGSPAIDGVPVEDFLKKYIELLQNKEISNIGWELINNSYPPDRITVYCSKTGDELNHYQRICWL
jgi:hypothetical protein